MGNKQEMLWFYLVDKKQKIVHVQFNRSPHVL